MPKQKTMLPAFKHGAYSNTTILPGEDPAAFEKLRRDLIEDLCADGPLENEIVSNIARLVWRKQSLQTFRTASSARERYEEIMSLVPDNEYAPFSDFPRITKRVDPAVRQAALEDAKRQAREELGVAYEFIEQDALATFQGLNDELDTEERINALIEKSLKRLLLVRGLKSLSPAPRRVLDASSEAVERRRDRRLPSPGIGGS